MQNGLMTQDHSSRKTLGILLFPEFETLDVFGPLQMFGMLPEQLNIVLTAEQPGLMLSTHGQAIFSASDNITQRAEYRVQRDPYV